MDIVFSKVCTIRYVILHRCIVILELGSCPRDLGLMWWCGFDTDVDADTGDMEAQCGDGSGALI